MKHRNRTFESIETATGDRLDRRRFIRAGLPLVMALPVIVRSQTVQVSPGPHTTGTNASLTNLDFDAEAVESLRNLLLQMVNEERASQGRNPLQLDPLASRVAGAHARAMSDDNFLSHWDRSGRKPYHRYALAGGTDANAENDGSADHNLAIFADHAARDIVDIHTSMYNEVPPNDGHRVTILAPQHTHVGFGMASDGTHVRLSELYLSRYVEVDPVPAVITPRATFTFSGRLIDASNEIQAIDVFYEPPPEPRDVSWLRKTGVYGLPHQRDTLFPKLPANVSYEDGSKGSITIDRKGRFKTRVKLPDKIGVYTLVVWLRRRDIERAFEATHVCVQAV